MTGAVETGADMFPKNSLGLHSRKRPAESPSLSELMFKVRQVWNP